jgi:uncharacterized delta-60 repeat protein
MKLVTRITLAAITFLLTLLPCFAAFTLDGTFAGGGKLTISFPDSTTNYSSGGLRIFVQPGGRILAAGTFTNMTADGQLPGVAVVGLTSGGMLDSTYASGGFHTDWQPSGFTSLNDALMYSDGRFLRLSRFFNVIGSSTGKAVRLNTDGSVDNVFGSNAFFGSPGGFGTISPLQISVRSDGKVLVLLSDQGELLLYRLNSDGTRDSTFGANGIVPIRFNKISSPSIVAMNVLEDGRIILVGHAGAPPSTEFFVARLGPAGNWDKTFGRVGFQTHPFGAGLTGRVQNALLQADGSLLLCGTVSSSDADVWMGRIRHTGRLDNSFGSAGVVIQDFAPGGADAATSIALSADGKIRLVGSVGSPSDFLVARFASNGQLEDSTSIPFTTGQNSAAADVAIQPDGKLVVIGVTRNPNANINGSVFAVARLTE